MHTLDYMRCLSRSFQRYLEIIITAHSGIQEKNFCILDNLVIFDDVYIIQQYAFLIFQSLSITQMMRQNA